MLTLSRGGGVCTPSENSDEEREDVAARDSRECEPSIWVTWVAHGWSDIHHRLGSVPRLVCSYTPAHTQYTTISLTAKVFLHNKLEIILFVSERVSAVSVHANHHRQTAFTYLIGLQ